MGCHSARTYYEPRRVYILVSRRSGHMFDEVTSAGLRWCKG